MIAKLPPINLVSCHHYLTSFSVCNINHTITMSFYEGPPPVNFHFSFFSILHPFNGCHHDVIRLLSYIYLLKSSRFYHAFSIMFVIGYFLFDGSFYFSIICKKCNIYRDRSDWKIKVVYGFN